MCLLCYSPPGIVPDALALEEAGNANPDGFGWSILPTDGSPLLTHRTLDLDASISSYLDALGKTSGDSLWHARYATHGKVSVKNVHPFRTDGGNTVIAHNGILPCQPKAHEKLSDTRVFVRDHWPTFSRGAIDHPRAMSALESFATGSKLVILTADPRFTKRAYIVNEEAGHWHEGTWWSNRSYVPYVAPTFAYNAWKATDDNAWPTDQEWWQNLLAHRNPKRRDLVQLTCQTCEEETTNDLADHRDHYCTWCQHCLYCDRGNYSCRCDDTY